MVIALWRSATLKFRVLLVRWSLCISSVRRRAVRGRAVGRWARSKALRWGSLATLGRWSVTNRGSINGRRAMCLRRTVRSFTIDLILLLLVGLQHGFRRTLHIGSRVKHVIVVIIG